MTSKLEEYKKGKKPTQSTNRLWPLYGAGLENLGVNDQPIDVPMPIYGPDELLVRHDACGLCFSDVKVIRLGQEHPRIHDRDVKKDPITLGHEVSMTVVGVGTKLKNQFKPGDRFILQADIFINGVGYAYGYMIQGGLSQYNVLDQRILNGDNGNYLIPINPNTGYAESAIVEPWACVIAAYHLKYRTELKAGGTAWFIGPEADRQYTISKGFNLDLHPGRIILTQMNGKFGQWLRSKAKELGIQTEERNNLNDLPNEPDETQKIDDIIVLQPDANLIEKVSPLLGIHAILAICGPRRLDRKLKIDVGRVHYDRWVYIGGSDPDISKVYSHMPVRSSLKAGGKVLFIGAGGPMGRMHVQHAIEVSNGPTTIICSDVSDLRLEDLRTSFEKEAKEKGKKFICLNPTQKAEYSARIAPFQSSGFDDVVVLAPIPAVISEAATHLANQGVMNIFAGVGRGTFADLDLNDTLLRDTRVIGHSASSIEDMRTMLDQVERGELSTNRSVAAIGSLEAVKDGMNALMDASYPGKVVIFPHIRSLALTSVPDLKNVLPDVYVKLKDGREWTKEAEETLLNTMLDLGEE